jgi:hypothetical protein
MREFYLLRRGVPAFAAGRTTMPFGIGRPVEVQSLCIEACAPGDRYPASLRQHAPDA